MSLKTTIQHFMGTLRCMRKGVPLGGWTIGGRPPYDFLKENGSEIKES